MLKCVWDWVVTLLLPAEERFELFGGDAVYTLSSA
jgi:hypothetical protein